MSPPSAEKEHEDDWLRHLLVGLAEHVEAEGILGLAQSAAGSTVSSLSRALSSSEFGKVAEDVCPSPTGAASSGGRAEDGRKKPAAVEVTGLEELLRVPDPTSLAGGDHRARGFDGGSSRGEDDSFRDALWGLESDDGTHREEVWFDAVDSPFSGYAPYDDEDDNEALRGVRSWSESLEQPGLAGDEAERGLSAHEAKVEERAENEMEDEEYWIDLRCLEGSFGENHPPPNGHHYALDDGCPTFRSVLDAAASLALDVLGPGSAEFEWRPDGDTARALAASSDRGDYDCTNRRREAEVLKWTGTHGGRSALKSRGVVRMSPRALLSVLLDTDRATEYNTNCAGKVRLRDFNNAAKMDDEPTTTTASIVRSSIRVPIIGAGIDTTCLVHSRPVEDGSDGSPSYVLVSIAVAHGPAGGEGGGGDGLVSASVLRHAPSDDGAAWCEVTNVARAALPVPVPGFLLRRAAEAGADGFFAGVRDVADRERVGSG